MLPNASHPRLSPTHIGGRIRAERERLGHSQAQAAELLGVHRSTYRQLEEGTDPQLSTLLALHAAGWDLRAIAGELFERRPKTATDH